MADQPQDFNIDINFSQLSQARQDAKDISKSFSELNDSAEKYNDLVDDLNSQLKVSVNVLKDLKNVGELWLKKTFEQKTAQEELNKGIKKYGETIKSIQDPSKEREISKAIADGLVARRKIGEYLSKSQEAQENLNDAIRKGVTNQQLLQDLKDKAISAATSLSRYEEKSANLAKIINGEYSLTSGTLSEQQKNQAKIAAVQALQNEQQKDIVKNRGRELKILNEMVGPYERFKAMAISLKEKLEKTDIGKFLNTQTAAIGLSVKAILDNFLSFDKILTDNAKQLGISAVGGRALAKNFEVAAYNAEQINKNATPLTANLKAQFEAQQQLNAALGTSVFFSDQERIDQTVITKQLGLQAQEGAELYKLGKLSGQTAKDVYTTTANQVIELRKSKGIQLDFKTVLQDVARVGAQVAAQYKNNPELIARAVAQVRALGLEFAQAAKMAESLLSFESSIENELKAELLTGKALNLEQARYYALMGDTGQAAEELMNNLGGMAEYQNLNVIQQKALAESIGLSRDELAKTLQTQELLKGTAWQTEAAFKEAAIQAARQGQSQEFINSLRQAGNAEELVAQASQISNQEKFQMAIEKLQETLVLIVSGPLGTMIDKFAKLVSNANVLKGIMYSIAMVSGVKLAMSIADMSKAFPGLLRGAQLFAIQMKRGSIAAALQTALSGNLVAILAGAAAAAAMVAMVNSALPGDDGGESVGSMSGGGIGGVNTNTAIASSRQPSQPIMIQNHNVTYVGPNKMSDFNTTSQIGQNNRVDTV